MPGGTHIAFPYATEEERASLLFAYVKAGIDHGEKCIAAVIEYTRDYWLRGLRDAGIAPEPLLGGQLLPHRLQDGGVVMLRHHFNLHSYVLLFI